MTASDDPLATTATSTDAAAVAADPVASIESDGLAQPISFDAAYGAGADRTIVLGGGGLFFVAWQIAYLDHVAQQGVDLGRAEIVVGTSAGSIVASILTAGRLHRFGVKVELLAKVPSLVSAMAPTASPGPSQMRALELFRDADDAQPDTIRSIGYAALAARANPAEQLQRSTALVMGVRKWRSSALQISTVDTYTGERLILRREHGLTLPHAAAASASVPGLFQPQTIGERRCMDGGVSGSGTHCDRVAGSTRALVLSLVGGDASTPGGMTMSENGQLTEIEQLRSTGTAVHLVGPAGVDVTELMDPQSVGRALELGAQQAAQDAPTLRSFWND